MRQLQSQNYGAGKIDRVKKSFVISLGYSFGVGLVLGGGLLVFGRQFLALFTTEEAVIDAGMKRITVMALAYCISAFMDCTIAAARGLGHTVVPTIIVILGSCVFRVIWVYTIFAHFHTIPALYLLYPCSWIITACGDGLFRPLLPPLCGSMHRRPDCFASAPCGVRFFCAGGAFFAGRLSCWMKADNTHKKRI